MLAATAVASIIVAVAVLFLVMLVWATLNASGVEWILVGLGWLLAIALRPRSAGLSPGVVVLDESEFPSLHELVRRVAAAVGVPAPRTVAVDLTFNAYVTTVGMLSRPAMVLGMPLMTALSWPGRLGVIGHELGHLRGRDTLRGRAIDAASNVVGGVWHFLAPERRHRDDLYLGRGFFTGGVVSLMTQTIQAILTAPFLLLGVALDRLSLSGRPHHEYLADRRSADVAGTDALVEVLATDLDGLLTSTAAAARRGLDPYEFLVARPPMTSQQRDNRMRQLAREPHRIDATHPRDDLRIRLLEADPRPASPLLAEIDVAGLEQELARLSTATSRGFRQDLIHGAYD